MNGAFLDLSLQLLPILAGVAFAIAIKRVAVLKDRVTIIADTPTGSAGIPPQIRDGSESPKDFEAAFDKEAHDTLLVNGMLGTMQPKTGIRELAFRKLGMADLDGFSRLQAKAKPDNQKLILFIRDIRDLKKRMLAFGSDSGELLQYLAGYGLEVRVI